MKFFIQITLALTPEGFAKRIIFNQNVNKFVSKSLKSIYGTTRYKIVLKPLVYTMLYVIQYRIKYNVILAWYKVRQKTNYFIYFKMVFFLTYVTIIIKSYNY